jgi:GNAT superfamily N-acetyltransferase
MYKGTTIVSVAQIELLNATEAALRHLETNEAHKKLGYATHLLKILENWAKQQAYKVIKLHANTKTENYYRALAISTWHLKANG